MDRLTLYNEGKTDKEIAEALGQEAKTICSWRGHYLLPTNAIRPTFDKKRAHQLWNDGVDDKDIAAELRCNKDSVRHWRVTEEMGANGFIYSWQTKLKPSELAKIPERYRNPKLCMKVS